jgi:hypothetical protein
VAERPILFSGPLVRSILDGRKTETRRLVTKGTSQVSDVVGERATWCGLADASRAGTSILLVGSGVDGHFIDCRIKPGDTLWVRERIWQSRGCGHLATWGEWEVGEWSRTVVRYHATDGDPESTELPNREFLAPRPSIHMPRWASRISLRVTDVRAERLQEITHVGALAEGVEPDEPGFNARVPFARLWDQINGKRAGASWADDPWVWVVKFEVAEVKR